MSPQKKQAKSSSKSAKKTAKPSASKAAAKPVSAAPKQAAAQVASQAPAPAAARPAAAPTGKTLTGKVISNKMQKTVSVQIERLVKHETYGKYLRRTTKLMAHDEADECREGDVVSITECRPISRHKSWRVVRVIERAPQ